MKVYAKIRQNGEYHSQNISQAVYGFREMGAEIVRYQKISDIYESVTKEDIVLDYITQVEMILKKFGVVPACEDYPVELRKFMGRNVWKDTINSINTHPEKWGVFVKPVKLFRISPVKAVADDGFRRVLELLTVKTVDTAKIGDAAFRRDARAAEKHDVVTFGNPGF